MMGRNVTKKKVMMIGQFPMTSLIDLILKTLQKHIGKKRNLNGYRKKKKLPSLMKMEFSLMI